MIAYRATLDVPDHTLSRFCGWLADNRRYRGARRGRRALGCRAQAVLVLRWFREGTPLRTLACDARIGIWTAYRYLHEGIGVLTDQAPDLHEVLARGRQMGWSHLTLDGTLIACDRVAARTEAGNDQWYAGKHRRHGGNIQIICDPTGFPVWTSPVEPGSTHDLTADLDTRTRNDLWRAFHFPDSGPYRVQSGTEDTECQNGAGSSPLSSRMRR